MRYRLLITLGIAVLMASSALAVNVTRTVTTESNLTFYPRSITINVGDTVTWQNPPSPNFFTHTATSDDGITFSSGNISPGGSFSHTFSIAGTFPYHCIFHGGINGSGMSGAIFVGNRTVHAPNEHVLQLSAYAFETIDTTTTTGQLGGFYRTTTAGTGEFDAPVTLPTGVEITGVELVACDNDGTNDVSVTLVKCPEPSGTCTNVALASSSGAPGCGFFSANPITPESVDNLGNLYLVRVLQPASVAGLSFRTVRLYYRLAISSGPAIATFTDVPTTHAFFQYIEALVASGATAGCSTTPPQYCPDAPVTRGQMAVFLARTLGLFWPNLCSWGHI